MSLLRTIRSFRKIGFKAYYEQMWGIGDIKSGELVGKDQFGNKYFQNYTYGEEVPGRHRWVIYSQHFVDSSQIPPEWHSWINHIRHEPPTKDPIMEASHQPWQQPWHESLTGTRGRFVTYSTTAPKVQAWEPVAAQRGPANKA